MKPRTNATIVAKFDLFYCIYSILCTAIAYLSLINTDYFAHQWGAVTFSGIAALLTFNIFGFDGSEAEPKRKKMYIGTAIITCMVIAVISVFAKLKGLPFLSVFAPATLGLVYVSTIFFLIMIAYYKFKANYTIKFESVPIQNDGIKEPKFN